MKGEYRKRLRDQSKQPTVTATSPIAQNSMTGIPDQ